MLQTVLHCDCACGCGLTWRWSADYWGARWRDVHHYGWQLDDYSAKCPFCRCFCQKADGLGLTWKEVSGVITALLRWNTPLVGKLVNRLNGALLEKLQKDASWSCQRIESRAPSADFDPVIYKHSNATWTGIYPDYEPEPPRVEWPRP